MRASLVAKVGGSSSEATVRCLHSLLWGAWVRLWSVELSGERAPGRGKIKQLTLQDGSCATLKRAMLPERIEISSICFLFCFLRIIVLKNMFLVILCSFIFENSILMILLNNDA